MDNFKNKLEKAEKMGLFDNILCGKCEAENKINWRKCKINASGV